MLPDVLTPEQVADYLQLDKETIYRLIRDRKLAATRIGRAYRIPREDLDAFMLAHSTRPEVRKALFDRVLAYAERKNPDGDSDEILEWLEQVDDERKQRRPPS
jgi:excisionase family DNA binding protein